MCEALSVSPSGYYAWRSRPDSPRKIANRDLLADIRRVHAQHQDCWDNAPMESFFGTLKTELVHHRQYPDRDTARRDLFAYIEGYYNRAHTLSYWATLFPHRREEGHPTSWL